MEEFDDGKNYELPESFFLTEEDFRNLQLEEQGRQQSMAESAATRRRDNCPRQKAIRNRKPYRQQKQKKIDVLNKRIKELEEEVKLLKSKNFCDRCRSSMRTTCAMVTEPSEKKEPAKPEIYEIKNGFSRQFEKFEIQSATPRPEADAMDVSGQIWIVMGLLMMLMGVNINGFDGTIDVYKVTRETVDYLRKQVEKSAETIVLPVFFSKVFSLEGSLGITNEINNEGFELEGLRLESIGEQDLMFQQHLNFNLKYEALIVMMEYMKQYASIK